MACESPPRKRAKLSLKFMKREKSQGSPSKPMRKLHISNTKDTTESDESKPNLSGESQTIKTEVTNQDAEPTSPPQPYVGFYNIGNTCYLNSVLQTLRYSPHFVTALKDMLHLAEEWLEQRGKDGVNETEDSGKGGGSRDKEVEEEENMRKTRQLLSEMYKLFQLMQDKEDNFLIMPLPDTDMAVNPEKVLDALRYVNPMFEGYLQHDAQELLCLLLSSLKEIQEKVAQRHANSEDDDIINNNKLETIPGTPTSHSNSKMKDVSGCLKGGCSPNLKKGQKRSINSESPIVARKHLSFASSGESNKVKGDCKEGVKLEEHSNNFDTSSTCNGKGDRKVKQSRRKSMRNRQREGSLLEGGHAEELESQESASDGKEGKKKSLGMRKLYKLANQPSILSRFNILKKRKQNSSSPTSSTSVKYQPLTSDNCTKEAVSGDTATCHLGKTGNPQSPGKTGGEFMKVTPTSTLSDSLNTSGTPTVIFQNTYPETVAGTLGKIKELFQGSLVLRTRCMECENHTERREEFQDISVPVPCSKKDEEGEELEDTGTEIEPSSESNSSCDVVMQSATLEWALSKFTLGERLTDANKYFCDKCLHLTEAERYLLFDHLPQIMVIHLKRFSAMPLTYSPGGSIPKINDHMVTPFSLSMDKWCTKSCQQRADLYQLFGVVSHTGSSSSSGHYLSYVRVPKLVPIQPNQDEPIETPHGDTHEWVLFDDDQVSALSDQEFEKNLNSLSESQDSTDTPYLLFYTRAVR
ncbi:Ubiquitin carboxyl-terminal hydrolase 1 [Holothuria leucospilota]|uniref:Ubiquitin carboxyl-terminal hydrolase n=1 Tax=Holothuria leucospilota TaxID=206669 RepID=A0A9Q1C447_HOLLE|nr:Ubiquitin carboxyl-terminal hydrolase 1 [Holothuria leucospilota]